MELFMKFDCSLVRKYVDLFYESIGIDRDLFRSEYYSILLNK